MRPLRPGQDIVLSSSDGAVDCRVIAAAGRYVLLQPEFHSEVHLGMSFFSGRSSLTFLDGMIPMGWNGTVEPGSRPGELRFCVAETEGGADRRSSVRIPVMAPVIATPIDGTPVHGHALDISAGGLRFRHAGRLDGHVQMRVRCELPGGLVIDADTIPRATESGITSVEFLAMHGASVREVGEWTINVLRAHLKANG